MLTELVNVLPGALTQHIPVLIPGSTTLPQLLLLLLLLLQLLLLLLGVTCSAVLCAQNTTKTSF